MGKGIGEQGPVTILLAEDEENDVIFFRRALRRQPGLELIWHAPDGDEAIRYLAGEGMFAERANYPMPDVLVLDLKMPNRNGYEVLEWLRGRLPRLKVGVLSSTDDPQEIRRVEQLRTCLFQTKSVDPVMIERFLHWLEQLVRADREGR